MKDKRTIPYHLQFIEPTSSEQITVGELGNHKMVQLLNDLFLTSRGGEKDTLENLHEHLRVAMTLELSTIPPYLCALYSIEKGDTTKSDYHEIYGDNAEAAHIIRSVMMEEMLHFTLVGNVLNAVGGDICINEKKYVPEYPTVLPDSAGLFKIHLSKFDKTAIKTFLRIEQPTPTDAKPALNGYTTIGQFYHAIVKLMEKLEIEAEDRGETIFTGDESLQIDKRYYYGGGGEIISVTNLESAKAAIDVILEQGEGSETSIYDTDHEEFGQIRELAHYFKFNEIYEERRYATCQTNPKDPPDGSKMHIKYDKVYNMGIDPKTANFVSPALKALSTAFNMEYRKLLDSLQAAFTGDQEQFLHAVAEMYKLRYQAVELMRIPIPGQRVNAGPSFEFLEDK